MENGAIRPKRCALHLDALALKDRLADPVVLQNTVRVVADIADMNIMNISVQNVGMEAATLERPARPWESGYSVQTLIVVKAALTSSHITIHSWPDWEFFMFDIVSCQTFDIQAVQNLLSDSLCIGKILEKYTN